VQQGLPPLPHAFRHRVVEALHTVGLPNLCSDSTVCCPPSHCHCERSEAIPRMHWCNIPRDCFASLAMTGRGHVAFLACSEPAERPL
jgi:hypothetical protein